MLCRVGDRCTNRVATCEEFLLSWRSTKALTSTVFEPCLAARETVCCFQGHAEILQLLRPTSEITEATERLPGRALSSFHMAAELPCGRLLQPVVTLGMPSYTWVGAGAS
jgi:hypothetical protein